MPPVHVYHPLEDPNADNAAEISQLFENGGEGTTVLLVPKAVYCLLTDIKVHHDGTTLATEGDPSFESGEQAILETLGEEQATAIDLHEKSNVTVKFIHIRGCRGWGPTKPTEEEAAEMLAQDKRKMGWNPKTTGSLVFMGGLGSFDSTIEGCRLEDPRGWTSLHVFDNGERQTVLNNIIGPCGQQAWEGPWADGISVASKNSRIAGNTVIDATDGAIVVFCAAGTVIENNTIIARTRDALGAINMVDNGPFQGDYTGTRVQDNVIRGEGAYFHLGIGVGSATWTDWKPDMPYNYGGFVENNKFGPGRFGYGIAVSCARDFTILGNTIEPMTRFEGNMDGRPVCNPTALLQEWKYKNRNEGLTLQDDFIEGDVNFLIGVKATYGDKLQFKPGQLNLDSNGMCAGGCGGLRVKGGRWELEDGGGLILRSAHKKPKSDDEHKLGHGDIIWQSPTPGGGLSGHGVVTLKEDASLVVTGDNGVVWDSKKDLSAALDDYGCDGSVGHAIVTLSAQEPYLNIQDQLDNIVFSTVYKFPLGWELRPNRFVAVLHPASRYKEPEDDCELKPVTWLYMSGNTGQLILHSSAKPHEPEEEHIHWQSSEPKEDTKDAKFIFQADGNAVIYAQHESEDNGFVPWASGTGLGPEGDENRGRDMWIYHAEEEGGARIEFKAPDGEVIWKAPREE